VISTSVTLLEGGDLMYLWNAFMFNKYYYLIPKITISQNPMIEAHVTSLKMSSEC
jgi:hypothetical protein